MNSLIDSLCLYAASSHQNTSFLRICIFILDHIRNLDPITASEIAESCYTSKSTLNKFCRYFGCENFSHLKKRIRAHLEIKSRQVITRYQNTSFHDLYAVYTQICLEACPMDEAECLHFFSVLADHLHQCRHGYIYGAVYPTILSLNFQASMLLFNHVFLGADILEASPERRVSPGDLLFFLSNTGAFFSSGLNEFTALSRLPCRKVIVSQKNSFIAQCPDQKHDYFFQMPGVKDRPQLNLVLLSFFDMLTKVYLDQYHGGCRVSG